MRVARRSKCLIALLALLTAACNEPNTTSHQTLPAAPVEDPRDLSTRSSSDAGLSAGSSLPDGHRAGARRRGLGDAGLSADSSLTAFAEPDALDAVPFSSATGSPRPTAPETSAKTFDPAAKTVDPAEAVELLEAARSSSFHQFGDGVYTWDSERRIVVLEVPVAHPALAEIRAFRGHWDGIVEDTPDTRSWVQKCARRHAQQAIGASDAVYGSVTAQSVYSCLGGLAHLAELFSRYWWTEAGVACVADAVAEHSLYGDAHPRPLGLCPSIGYDPSVARQPGWLARRCAAIVTAHPNPRYPVDPDGVFESGSPLPSCWQPLIEVIQAHAADSADIGLPDSPHHCYHAFLGYVWARQTGRESRPPSDLAVGCHYRAFEASS